MDKFIEWVSSIPNIKLYATIGTVVLLAIGLIAIFFPSVKEALIRYGKVKDKQDKDFKRQTKNRYVEDHIRNRLGKWFDEVFKYSRVYIKGKVKTSWQYFIRTFLISVALFLFLAILVEVSAGAIAFFAVWFVRYAYLELLRMKNNREIESEIVLFLNLLSNYSTGNSEIISVFAAIAPKLKPVLRSCLLECVSESQGSQGTVSALANLGRKVESRKFKEVLKSLEISQKYSGGFSQTTASLKSDSQAYQGEKQKLNDLIRENMVTFGLITITVLVIIAVVGSTLEEDIWECFSEPLGIGVIVVFFGVCGWFLKQLIKINK